MNKKRFLSLLLALTMVISLVPAFTISSLAVYDNLTFSVWNPDDGEGYAILYSCDPSATGVVTVPSEYEGYPVKYIAENAFKDCTEITSINISENVEVINDYAFSGCTSLVSVSFPASLLGAGDFLFDNCPEIQNLFFPNAETLFNVNFQLSWAPATPWNLYLNNRFAVNMIIPEGIEVATDGILANCQSVRAITFPESIKEIGLWAFADCVNLTYITIPDVDCTIYDNSFDGTAYANNSANKPNGVLYIGKHLIHADNTIGTINVKNGTLTIASSAFTSSKATAVNIPDSVIRLSQSFALCESLESVTIGKGIKVIPFRCFDGCTSLKSVTLPEGLEVIERRGFADCTSLTSIVLPSTLTSLVGGFHGCSSLKTINIPASLEDIDLTQFRSSSLESITFDENHPRYTSENGVVYNLDKTEIAFVLSNISNVFRIPEGVTKIGNNAFEGCTKLTDVILHNNVKHIGDSAFLNCKNLAYINLHDNLDYIGVDALKNTAYMNNLIENSEDGNAYSGDTLILATRDQVVIKEGITRIAPGAINSDTITTITFPSTLNYIGRNFYAPNLERVNVFSLVTWLRLQYEDDSANILKNCPKAKVWLSGICIETTLIPDEITTIGSYKYANNKQFDFAIIPRTVTTIEENAFYGCSERLIFRVHKNSEAHRYAEANGIKYVFIKERNSENTIVDTENNEIVTDEELLDDPEQILPEDLGSLIEMLGTTKIYSLQIFGTGSKLVVIINGVRYEFTLIVRGDVNGDGVCDALDAEFLHHLLNGKYDKNQHGHHKFRAMDTDDNDEITVEDYQNIVNKVVA